MANNETEALERLRDELNLSNWGQELLGQSGTTNIDFELVEERLPRTELLAAEEIARKFKHRISYVPATGTWYIWNGTIHLPCEGDDVAIKVVRDYFKATVWTLEQVRNEYFDQARKLKASKTTSATKDAEAKRKEYSQVFGKHKSFRDKLTTNVTQRAVVTQLKTLLDVSSDHYEKDNQYLVVRNGVIDLADFKATGMPSLLPHDPARAVYRYFDADYNPSTQPEDYPNWRRFLATSVIDWDTACLLQKGVGAAFAATHKPRVMFNLLGAPASGKSLFLSVFDKLGNGYSVMPNNQAVQANNGDTNPYQDDLRGARFVGFSEVQGKKPLDDGFIKGIMGGDKQNTRKLYAKQSPWVPQCVMFVASNMALKIDTRDSATFGKLLPISFPHSFTDTDPEHLIDLDLEDKALAERDGILHWVLQGMALYWKQGLHATESVMAAMDTNKTAGSHAIQFMQALIEAGVVVEDPNAVMSSCLPLGEAYNAFRVWAESQGIKNPALKQTFVDDISSYYHGKYKSGQWRFVHLTLSEKAKAKDLNSMWWYSVVDQL